jgi:3'-phosphoadenosine 5'-phosphosulfate sulfotransferase (PAPS reductase)/FAD synthetase
VRPQVQPARSANDAPVRGVAEENKTALALVCGKRRDELAARQKTPSSSRSNRKGAGAMRNPVHRVAYGNVAMARHVYREWRGRHSKWNS